MKSGFLRIIYDYIISFYLYRKVITKSNHLKNLNFYFSFSGVSNEFWNQFNSLQTSLI